jgi:hypothetical protein
MCFFLNFDNERIQVASSIIMSSLQEVQPAQLAHNREAQYVYLSVSQTAFHL